MGLELVALGIDSLLACLAVAPAVSSPRARIVLAAVLGVADGVASFAAGVGGMTTYAAAAGIVAVSIVFALCVPGTFRYRRLCALPILLSIDNLATPLSPGDAVVAGLVSGALAGLGFAASMLVYRLIPVRYHAVSAALLGGVAVLATIEL